MMCVNWSGVAYKKFHKHVALFSIYFSTLSIFYRQQNDQNLSLSLTWMDVPSLVVTRPCATWVRSARTYIHYHPPL